MKYGIIMHYDVHNHGALLQLNALKQILKLYVTKVSQVNKYQLACL